MTEMRLRCCGRLATAKSRAWLITCTLCRNTAIGIAERRHRRRHALAELLWREGAGDG